MSPLPSLRRGLTTALCVCSIPWLSGCGGPIEGSDAYDVQRYDLAGEYDWSRDRLVATLGITLVTTEPSVRAVRLDSRVTEVRAVRAAGGRDLAFSTDEEAGTLAVDVSSFGTEQQDAGVSITIEYEAAPGDALNAISPRAGDPVAVRALFTDSEPRDAPEWMPCHDVPADRALVSFDMRMAANEELIANGDLVLDEPGSVHRMKYETKYPLPTYQMAFAVSDFEVEEADAGGVPVSVWHRPGVAGDYPATLKELQRLVDTFEPLLGPYPFEKYALVMLPEFSGGMENAGVTFQSEISTSQPALSAALIAHEFGHQWFGDAVTVATWDDLWIKEGMAVLLETEAARPFEDRSEKGVLFGDRFFVRSGEAARDPALAPADKYTSGPYDRSAWIFTQIRSLVGEEVFWATMRGLVEDHLYGTVSTEEVLAAFEPHLGEEAAAAAARAVDARDLPRIEVQTEATGAARVTLQDPEGILIAPLEIEWRREDGTTEREALVPGQAQSLSRDAEGDLLVVDPADIHPDLAVFLADDANVESYGASLAPLTVPAAAPAVASLSDIAGIHQYSSLLNGSPPVTPDAFAAFAASLDGDSALATSVAAGCSLAAEEMDPVVQQEWVDVLTPVLTAEPVWRGLPYARRPRTCAPGIEILDLFAPEWAQLSSGLTAPTLPVERVYYLATFDMPLADLLDVWMPPAKDSYSLRIRSIAARQVRQRGLVAADAEGNLAAWRSAVLDLLARSDASEVLRQLTPAAPWFAAAPAADKVAFRAQMLRVLRLPTGRLAHAAALCGAYVLLHEQAGAWESFTAELGETPLSARGQAILEDPSVCL